MAAGFGSPQRLNASRYHDGRALTIEYYYI